MAIDLATAFGIGIGVFIGLLIASNFKKILNWIKKTGF